MAAATAAAPTAAARTAAATTARAAAAPTAAATRAAATWRGSRRRRWPGSWWRRSRRSRRSSRALAQVVGRVGARLWHARLRLRRRRFDERRRRRRRARRRRRGRRRRGRRRRRRRRQRRRRRRRLAAIAARHRADVSEDDARPHAEVAVVARRELLALLLRREVGARHGVSVQEVLVGYPVVLPLLPADAPRGPAGDVVAQRRLLARPGVDLPGGLAEEGGAAILLHRLFGVAAVRRVVEALVVRDARLRRRLHRRRRRVGRRLRVAVAAVVVVAAEVAPPRLALAVALAVANPRFGTALVGRPFGAEGVRAAVGHVAEAAARRRVRRRRRRERRQLGARRRLEHRRRRRRRRREGRRRPGRRRREFRFRRWFDGGGGSGGVDGDGHLAPTHTAAATTAAATAAAAAALQVASGHAGMGGGGGDGGGSPPSGAGDGTRPTFSQSSVRWWNTVGSGGRLGRLGRRRRRHRVLSVARQAARVARRATLERRRRALVRLVLRQRQKERALHVRAPRRARAGGLTPERRLRALARLALKDLVLRAAALLDLGTRRHALRQPRRGGVVAAGDRGGMSGPRVRRARPHAEVAVVARRKLLAHLLRRELGARHRVAEPIVLVVLPLRPADAPRRPA